MLRQLCYYYQIRPLLELASTFALRLLVLALVPVLESRLDLNRRLLMISMMTTMMMMTFEPLVIRRTMELVLLFFG